MPQAERQSYDTHYNYIRCLGRLMAASTLTFNPHLRQATIPAIDKKANLIRLTRQSLNDERAIVEIDQDYSYASTSWLPVKSYYFIFNILLTIEYIIKLTPSSFNLGHSACISEFTRKLENNEIVFSEPILNQVFDASIFAYRLPAGANLSRATPAPDMFKLAMKKIAKYKEEEWKRANRIDLRKRAHKIRHQQYLVNFRVSVFDFPYYMRLRSNYRDFAFIDGIDATETADYFKAYFAFTEAFTRNLESVQITLANRRLTGV